MTVNLNAPDSNRSYAIAADWLELLALSRVSGVSTSIDINESGDILSDPAMEDAESAGDDLDILNVATEAATDAVFDEIGFRVECLGEKYPFRVSFEDRRFRMQLVAPGSDDALNSAHDIYITCLLMSCVRFGLLDAGKSGVSVEEIGTHFQVLATVAAAGYMGGDAYLFGHPRPDSTPLLNAVQRLSELIRAGTPVSSRPSGMSMSAKDGGIDVVAWRDHADQRPSKAVMFGQCASGRNWPGKSVTEYVKEFRHYFSRWISEHWLPAIFVPFPIYAEKERSHALQTETDRAAYYLARESSVGVIIDRLRLVHWACEVWGNPPDAANEALADISKVWDWRDQALAAARAA